MNKPRKFNAKDKKNGFHPRNPHRSRYNFPLLVKHCPELAQYVSKNKYQELSVDFSDPKAVKELNAAILKHYYKLKYWDIPIGYLCPPIPGRADYVHHLADLLANDHDKQLMIGKKVNVLDIGTGANIVYPIIGAKAYGWRFVASDIDKVALTSAKKIIDSNPWLEKKVEVRHQKNRKQLFEGIIKPKEQFTITLCNPPFYASQKEAIEANQKKRKNLKLKKDNRNFGGMANELWCDGGELAFIKHMIVESKSFGSRCLWFTSLVSKKENLNPLLKIAQQYAVSETKIITMSQGQKTSRFMAWTFMTTEERTQWTHKADQQI